MEELVFLTKWGNNKERAWSGTNWSLYNALNKYFNIDDVNLSLARTIVDRIIEKCIRPDISFRETKRNGKYAIQKIKREKPTRIFQFAENVFDTNNLSTYIYQDLSVSYVEYMMDNMPDIFAVSAFQDHSPTAIRNRASYQNKYYQLSKGIFTMGRWLAEDMVNRCHIEQAKVHPVGGGINLDKSLIDASQKKGNKILFVGRDFKRKGGHIVVEAFKELKKRRKEVELYVAGPSVNPYHENIDGYHFMGDCDYKKTAELFNLCDIYCMPSYFEAYGLVFVEALTFGLPVIARNAYEMPFLIQNGQTGLLLQKYDVKELSEMMDSLLSDVDIKKNVIDRQQDYLIDYSWDKVAERIYSKIL